VDRIARTAHTSKERVYAHFGSKQELYAVVAEHELATASQAVQLDPGDMPAYAAALFDYFTTHPDSYRFISWGRLELRTSATPDTASDPAPNTYAQPLLGKAEKIRAAQQSGDLDPTWDPVDVLGLVSQLATSWVGQPEVAALAAEAAVEPTLAARREAVLRAVRTLFPPTTKPSRPPELAGSLRSEDS
jgi:AcrR family transcriptional regulator